VSRARAECIASVAALVPAAVGDDCVRVGVDGVDGAGKSFLAGELVAALQAVGRPVVAFSVDGWHHVRERRYARGRHSPEGFWLDSFDYARLLDEALRPLGPGGSREFRREGHDLATDAVVHPPLEQAPAGAVVVVDGLFLHRAELEGAFELTVFVDVPFPESVARMAARDGSPADASHPELRRYVEAQRRYLRACRPRERADVVVDNADLSAPRVVRP